MSTFPETGAETRSAERSIADLAIGEATTIAKVACARPVALRLMEMGLLPGTRVELVRKAPLGDPVELRVRGYALSIRKAEASLVMVEAVAGSAARDERAEARDDSDPALAARVARTPLADG